MPYRLATPQSMRRLPDINAPGGRARQTLRVCSGNGRHHMGPARAAQQAPRRRRRPDPTAEAWSRPPTSRAVDLRIAAAAVRAAAASENNPKQVAPEPDRRASRQPGWPPDCLQHVGDGRNDGDGRVGQVIAAISEAAEQVVIGGERSAPAAWITEPRPIRPRGAAAEDVDCRQGNQRIDQQDVQIGHRRHGLDDPRRCRRRSWACPPDKPADRRRASAPVPPAGRQVSASPRAGSAPSSPPPHRPIRRRCRTPPADCLVRRSRAPCVTAPSAISSRAARSTRLSSAGDSPEAKGPSMASDRSPAASADSSSP